MLVVVVIMMNMVMFMSTYSTLTSSKVTGKGRRATVTAIGSHQEPLLTGDICVLWDKTASRSSRNSRTTSTATTIPLLPLFVPVSTILYFILLLTSTTTSTTSTCLPRPRTSWLRARPWRRWWTQRTPQNQMIMDQIRRLEDKWKQNTSQNQRNIVKRYLVTFPALKGETGDFCFLVIVIMTNL